MKRPTAQRRICASYNVRQDVYCIYILTYSCIYSRLFGRHVQQHVQQPVPLMTAGHELCITQSHYHAPLERFSKLDCSTAKRVPIPNDSSSESSRRDVSSADLLSTDTAVNIPTVEVSRYRPWNIDPGVRGVVRCGAVWCRTR